MLDLSTDPHPILSRLARVNVGAAVYGFAAEFAYFAFGLNDFFSLEVAL